MQPGIALAQSIGSGTQHSLIAHLWQATGGIDSFICTSTPDLQLLHKYLSQFKPKHLRHIAGMQSLGLNAQTCKRLRRQMWQLAHMNTLEPQLTGFAAIPLDSFWSKVVQRHSRVLHAFNQAQGDWPTLYKALQQKANVWQIAGPVFFGEGSLLLFYYVRNCGLECGEVELGIYRLQDGGITQVGRVGGGVY